MTEAEPKLNHQSIIVTGAAAGIGAATVRACLDAGATVLAVDRDERVRELEHDPQATAFVCDIRDRDAPERAVDQVLAAHGRLDGLVNIAGVVSFGALLEASDDDWTVTLDTDLLAPVAWSRAALGPMVAARRGAIVNLASIAALGALPGRACYTVAKAGLVALTRSVAADYGRDGIRCNCISPGSIETAMLRRYCEEDPQRREELLALNPMRELGQPEDVAACCVHLLSAEARFTNGANVIIDGGRTIVV
jgi:NAD(P)-dependent dehydrogenase (short-subunit alcohol dehydrogenase family)